ncbi:MAG: DUF4199 domain-containing protein [Cytophagales bacterium]
MIKKNRILKTGLIFGAVALIAAILNFYTSLLTGSIPFVNGHLTDIVITIVAIVGSIYFFKTYINNGYLHLWQGIVLGLWTLWVSVNFIALFQYIYLEWINPDLLQEYKNYMQKELVANAEALKKEEFYTEAKLKLEAFLKSKPIDVVWHQMFLKFLPFPITILSVFFASLAFRKVEK